MGFFSRGIWLRWEGLFRDGFDGDFSAEDCFAFYAVFVGIIEIAIKYQDTVVVDGDDFGVVAGAVPIVECGRCLDDVGEFASVGGCHYFKGFAPLCARVVEGGAYEHSGARVADECDSVFEAAQARQCAEFGEFFGFCPSLAVVGRTRVIHRRPLFARVGIPVGAHKPDD